MGGSGIGQFPRLVTGYGAACLSAYFLIRCRTDLPIVVTSIYFIFVCVIDTNKSKIPNLLNLALALFGVIYFTTLNGWSGLSHSFLGLALGLILLMGPYLMGGFGAGDVKALGALGAVTGPEALLHIFIYMAFFGGAMSVLHYLCNRDLMQKTRDLWLSLQTATMSQTAADLTPDKKETLRFPYAAAIALGYYSYLIWGTFL